MSAYKFDHKYRGAALIIGNDFSGERKGCSNDIEMAEELFKRLDFNVTRFKNLTAAKMKEKMKKASSDKNNKYSDCFVLVLSSHGSEENKTDKKHPEVWRHVVLGNDDSPVYVDEIMDIFDDEKSSLKGKPKLFLFRSRTSASSELSAGDPYDVGFEVKVIKETEKTASLELHGQDKTDSTNKPYAVDLTDAEDIYKGWEKDEDASHSEAITETASQATEQDAAGVFDKTDSRRGGNSDQLPESPFDIVPIKCPNDFLIMYPVMSGKFAFRKPKTGSYLIRFLKENLADLLAGCNLLQYLTHVNNNMAEYEYKPNLADMSLESLRNHLYRTIKYLSIEVDHEKLVAIIGEEHRSILKADPTIVEPYLRDLIKNTLNEKQMKDILNIILPFKMAACVVHRLTGDIHFQPKKDNSCMGIIWKSVLPKATNV